MKKKIKMKFYIKKDVFIYRDNDTLFFRDNKGYFFIACQYSEIIYMILHKMVNNALELSNVRIDEKTFSVLLQIIKVLYDRGFAKVVEKEGIIQYPGILSEQSDIYFIKARSDIELVVNLTKISNLVIDALRQWGFSHVIEYSDLEDDNKSKILISDNKKDFSLLNKKGFEVVVLLMSTDVECQYFSCRYQHPIFTEIKNNSCTWISEELLYNLKLLLGSSDVLGQNFFVVHNVERREIKRNCFYDQSFSFVKYTDEFSKLIGTRLILNRESQPQIPISIWSLEKNGHIYLHGSGMNHVTARAVAYEAFWEQYVCNLLNLDSNILVLLGKERLEKSDRVYAYYKYLFYKYQDSSKLELKKMKERFCTESVQRLEKLITFLGIEFISYFSPIDNNFYLTKLICQNIEVYNIGSSVEESYENAMNLLLVNSQTRFGVEKYRVCRSSFSVINNEIDCSTVEYRLLGELPGGVIKIYVIEAGDVDE